MTMKMPMAMQTSVRRLWGELAMPASTGIDSLRDDRSGQRGYAARSMGADVFRQAFEAGDVDAIMADLAPSFLLYHAARAEPAPASAPIHLIFTVARETMGDDFRFTEYAQGDGL